MKKSGSMKRIKKWNESNNEEFINLDVLNECFADLLDLPQTKVNTDSRFYWQLYITIPNWSLSSQEVIDSGGPRTIEKYIQKSNLISELLADVDVAIKRVNSKLGMKPQLQEMVNSASIAAGGETVKDLIIRYSVMPSDVRRQSR